jgi:trafficking protein particle complex subunit 2
VVRQKIIRLNFTSPILVRSYHPSRTFLALAENMSYYFAIISPIDTPLFELTFGTSKAGGDGVAHFRKGETSRYMNQFIVHAALDVVEEVQWLTSNMWLKVIDSYAPTSSHVSCFITGSNHRFMLLHQPTPVPTSSAGSRASTISSNSIPHNPTGAQTEDAIRQFMTEIFELWVKATMNPFYRLNSPVVSPVFRQRVTAAGRKWL